MKIGHSAWPLMGIAGMAMAQADYSTSAPAAAAVQEAAAQAVVKTSARPLRESGPDLRHCLELKTDKAIIRCAESRRTRGRP